MRIAVIDGQGGGIGKALVEKLRAGLGKNTEILALGTNAAATAAMLKAGADEGASGENAIVVNAPRVDVIAGCIGILAAGSMLGEVTPAMAAAVGMSDAAKVLIPLGKCMIHVAGVAGKPLPQYILDAVAVVKNMAEHKKTGRADVYLADEAGNTMLLMESVDKVVPGEENVCLQSASGEQKTVRARIREMELSERRIVLKKI